MKPRLDASSHTASPVLQVRSVESRERAAGIVGGSTGGAKDAAGPERGRPLSTFRNMGGEWLPMTTQTRRAMAPLALTVSELARASGQDLGTSDWLRVEQDRVNLFADATDDHQWIHVDRDRAAEGPFKTTIAHGYLTLSLVPRLLDELLVVADQVRGTNYGLERVRFTDPVPVGSSIRLAARLSEASVRDDGGVQYKVAIRVEIDGRDRPAMVGESIYLAYAE